MTEQKKEIKQTYERKKRHLVTLTPEEVEGLKLEGITKDSKNGAISNAVRTQYLKLQPLQKQTKKREALEKLGLAKDAKMSDVYDAVLKAQEKKD